MHSYLKPFSESKIITCLKGEIFDVIVDLRIKSPTYLKWESIILSEQNNDSILIPKGFAHGFQTLCNDCELLYLHDMPYRFDFENGIKFDDSTININWPIEITNLSERDKKLPNINSNFKGIIT
jgi:dTDP-4-dehydrorhamnose 3,5-epimerase